MRVTLSALVRVAISTETQIAPPQSFLSLEISHGKFPEIHYNFLEIFLIAICVSYCKTLNVSVPFIL